MIPKGVLIVNLETRIQRLEKGAQVDVPAGARLYNTDGVQVDAIVTRMPAKESYGEAMLPMGAVVKIAPTRTLGDVIWAARHRKGKEETEESDASIKLLEGILFLRVAGGKSFYEYVNRAQKRKKRGVDSEPTEANREA